MKNKLIIAVLLLCFSIGLCIFEAITVDKITNEATEMLTAIKSTSSSGQSSKELTELCKELSEFWEEKRWILEMLIEHEEVEEVYTAVRVLLTTAETAHPGAFTALATEVDARIVNIKDRGATTLSNIW